MVSCGIPRLLLAGVAGALFGFWRGLLIAECATVLGYYGVFMFVRWGGQQWVLHRWPRLRKWADHLKGQGIVGVILLRQMPIHGTLTNLALGLSGMKPAVFVIGTAIGLFPEGIPAVMVGSSLLQGSAKKIATMLGGAVVVFVVLFVVAGYFVRSRKNQSTATALLNEQLTINEPPEN